MQMKYLKPEIIPVTIYITADQEIHSLLWHPQTPMKSTKFWNF